MPPIVLDVNCEGYPPGHFCTLVLLSAGMMLLQPSLSLPNTRNCNIPINPHMHISYCCTQLCRLHRAVEAPSPHLSNTPHAVAGMHSSMNFRRTELEQAAAAHGTSSSEE
jgi:hypothetical protein